MIPSLLGRCKQKQRGLRRLLCRWPSITEWEVYITAQGPRLRNDLYYVEWDVKLYTIPYHQHSPFSRTSCVDRTITPIDRIISVLSNTPD